MTISYKEKGRVPMVAHVPAHPITFKEFRKYLGISSRCNLQYASLFTLYSALITTTGCFCFSCLA